MADFLLLGQDARCTDALRFTLMSAGYEVVEVRDIVSCCRRLQADEPASARPAERPAEREPLPPHPPGITLINADTVAAHAGDGKRQEHLRDCIVSLARQLTPGWRLSLRHHRLQAPTGAAIGLTSLEFRFIKIFSMVDMGESVSRKQIVRDFGENYLSYDQNRIDTMVRRLRKKIVGQLGIELPLHTERVRGFSFGAVLTIDP